MILKMQFIIVQSDFQNVEVSLKMLKYILKMI